MFKPTIVLSSVVALLFFVADNRAESKGNSKPQSAVDQVNTSFGTWKKLNKQSKGNYSYTVRRSSFSGFQWTTTITVRANKVVERKFEVVNLRQPVPVPGEKAGKNKGPKWIEKGKDIGKHKEGAKPSTIDELYAEAIIVASTQLKDFQKRYVGFHPNGVLKHCFYIDTRIADDAPSKGVRITTLTMGGK